MPVTGSPEFDEDRRASWFSHKGETSRPYYYKVYLAEHDVVAEMAPTERAALFRFTFPETEQAYVVVDAFDRGSSVRIIPGENKVVGYSTRNSGECLPASAIILSWSSTGLLNTGRLLPIPC